MIVVESKYSRTGFCASQVQAGHFSEAFKLFRNFMSFRRSGVARGIWCFLELEQKSRSLASLGMTNSAFCAAFSAETFIALKIKRFSPRRLIDFAGLPFK